MGFIEAFSFVMVCKNTFFDVFLRVPILFLKAVLRENDREGGDHLLWFQKYLGHQQGK